ncbi:MAG: ABC transporter substrate-binding protein, partial [Sphingomonadales bacterium]
MTKHNKIIWLTSLLAVAVLAYYFATQNNTLAKGGKQFGGELHLAIKSKRTYLNPLAANTLDHHRVQQLIFEPLIKPASNQRGWKYLLAKKITVLSDKKTVRIALRKNVRFAPDPCFRLASDELTSADVVFSLSLACANNKHIEQSNYFARLIAGGAAFYQHQENPFLKKVKGIRVIDDYLLEIKLTAPYNHFIQILGSPGFGIMSLQAAKYYKSLFYKHPVGTGPFQLHHSDRNKAEFRSNKNYWRKDVYGNQLPYTDKVFIKYGVSGAEAQQLFLQNKLDLLFDLPV